MKKRLLSVFLVLCMVLMCLPSSVFAIGAATPEILGVENGETYCGSQVVTITGGGEPIIEIKVNDVPLDLNSDEYSENGAVKPTIQITLDPHDGEQTVSVKSQASVSVTVTINNGHTYEWKSENGKYWQRCSVCEHETEKKDIPTLVISTDKVCRTQDYEFSIVLPDNVDANKTTYGYAFENKGDDDILFNEADNKLIGTVSKSEYFEEENSFVITVNAKTTDGFEFTVDKTVTIQNSHSGGTATCSSLAECEVCGEEYGDFDEDEHSDIDYVEANPATKDAPGNIGFWYCVDCHKMFSDRELTNEIFEDDIFIEYVEKSPKTEDSSNIILYFAILAICGMTLATVVINKKEHMTK